jgi:dolichol-phosphate mannosyltransferase
MPPAVVIPTYNESDNIQNLANEILALPVNARVIVVDDNSPDGTGI